MVSRQWIGSTLVSQLITNVCTFLVMVVVFLHDLNPQNSTVIATVKRTLAFVLASISLEFQMSLSHTDIVLILSTRIRYSSLTNDTTQQREGFCLSKSFIINCDFVAAHCAVFQDLASSYTYICCCEWDGGARPIEKSKSFS